MSESFEKADELRKDAEKLLKELELALRTAYLNFKDPYHAANTFDGKFRALFSRMDTLMNSDPNARAYLGNLKSSVTKEREKMVSAARKAHQDRGVVDPELAAKYNDQIGKGLTAVPEGGKRLLSSQIDGTVRQMVDAVITYKEVPPHIRSQIARSLGQWIKRQDEVQDAFFVVQSVLLDISEFLHQKLTIQGQIEATRDHVKKQGQLTPQQASEADKCVGDLAKRSVELDRMIQRRIEQSVMRVKAHFSISPRLVLDPTKAFLGALEAKAGIQLRQNGVTVDIGAKLRIVDPLNAQGVGMNPYINVNVPNGPSLGVEGQTTINNRGLKGHEVKATLTWTF